MADPTLAGYAEFSDTAYNYMGTTKSAWFSDEDLVVISEVQWHGAESTYKYHLYLYDISDTPVATLLDEQTFDILWDWDATPHGSPDRWTLCRWGDAMAIIYSYNRGDAETNYFTYAARVLTVSGSTLNVGAEYPFDELGSNWYQNLHVGESIDGSTLAVGVANYGEYFLIELTRSGDVVSNTVYDVSSALGLGWTAPDHYLWRSNGLVHVSGDYWLGIDCYDYERATDYGIRYTLYDITTGTVVTTHDDTSAEAADAYGLYEWDVASVDCGNTLVRLAENSVGWVFGYDTGRNWVGLTYQTVSISGTTITPGTWLEGPDDVDSIYIPRPVLLSDGTVVFGSSSQGGTYDSMLNHIDPSAGTWTTYFETVPPWPTNLRPPWDALEDSDIAMTAESFHSSGETRSDGVLITSVKCWYEVSPDDDPYVLLVWNFYDVASITPALRMTARDDQFDSPRNSTWATSRQYGIRNPGGGSYV